VPPSRRSVRRELRSVQTSLISIARALGRLGASLERASGAATPRATRRAAPKLTPARKAALKLQGQYIGYMRNLRPAQRNRVKAMRETKGVLAAIRLAKQLGGV
jgi:hypothetical protein